ncbi:MAG: insulinase family protein [Rhodothermales bacterium]|nr:insulinase family protein [Rhodothermales bacterium]MBO6778362.1 insulinase family protein [Rhodothermales bacterium]
MRLSRLVPLLLLFFLPACASEQAVLAPPPVVEAETSSPVLPTDSLFTIGKLENGLTYIIRPNDRPSNRALMWLAVNAGSVLEDDDQRGMAHFLEHMAFNGTRDFDKTSLVTYLESIGMRFGPDVNAVTSFDETLYMLEVPTDSAEIVDQAFRILENWAGGISLNDEDIEAERGVVLEELRQGRGATARVREKQYPSLFSGSRYAERLPIGSVQSIQESDPEAIRRFYRDWYRPDLMAVIVVGDLDPEEVEARIVERFSALQGPESPRPRPTFNMPPHETKVAAVTDPEARSTSVNIYRKLPPREVKTEAQARAGLVEGLYHGLINLRFQELTRRPDPPFTGAGSLPAALVRSTALHMQYAGVRDGDVIPGLEALLTEVERVRRHGFTATELDRAKVNLMRFWEQVYAERDRRPSTAYAAEAVMHFLGGAAIPGVAVNYELNGRLLPGITLEEVNAVAREMSEGFGTVIAVSGPEKEDAPLPSNEEILAVFDRVRAAEDIEPWEDDAPEGALLAEKPRPGMVIRRNHIEELGVTEWTLLNGVKVILKPTDFQENEILIGATSPGGLSLISDEDYVSGDFATLLLQAGGVADFDRTQLQKWMAGKLASVSMLISDVSEDVIASGAASDAETLFQLIYARFTAPRLDLEAAETWRHQLGIGFANRNTPSSALSDSIRSVWSRGHARERATTTELLQEVDFQRALEVYQDRFADASDFHFVIVGNIDLKEIEPLVITYLGGLPSIKREETWQDHSPERPDGVTEVVVHKGLEQQSRVEIRFHGEASYSSDASLRLGALADVMRTRLREVLREEMGAVYGVSVSGYISRIPTQRYTFTVRFGCAPENVHELEQAVFNEIAKVKSEGLTEAEVAAVRETRKRTRETRMEENSFWRSALDGAYTRGDDPRRILTYYDRIAALSKEALQQTAIDLLDPEQVLIARLFPE